MTERLFCVAVSADPDETSHKMQDVSVLKTSTIHIWNEILHPCQTIFAVHAWGLTGFVVDRGGGGRKKIIVHIIKYKIKIDYTAYFQINTVFEHHEYMYPDSRHLKLLSIILEKIHKNSVFSIQG